MFTAELKSIVEAEARATGFAACGVAPVPEDEQEYFAEWVAAGRAGEMEYLKRADEQGRLLRSSLRVALPWARSVIVCAWNYNANTPISIDPAPPDTGWIARYAQSGDAAGAPADYHNVMLGKLRRIEAVLRKNGTGEFESRCYVDTGPVVERVFAQYAGIGWTGKNTCILNEKLGSWLFLGVIVTSLGPAPEMPLTIAADRCGSCTRCIDACPTNALVAPRQMDASLCIAYLTIEKKGSIAEELRGPMGRQVFGCDICQDVCPWNSKNTKAPIQTSPEMQPREQLINPSLTWLAELDSAGFKRLFKGSPVERTKLKGLRRNVAIAMGNTEDAQFLPRLQEWSGADDLVLRDTAQWAMEKIGPNNGRGRSASMKMPSQP